MTATHTDSAAANVAAKTITRSQRRKPAPSGPSDLFESPLDLAQTCLEEADGDTEQAVEAITELLVVDARGDAAWLRQIMRHEASGMVSQIHDRNNKAILRSFDWKAAQRPGAKRDSARARAYARDRHAEMMNMTIFGGKRLGEATADELTRSGEFFTAEGRNATRKGKYHLAVAERLKARRQHETDCVRDCMSGDQLATLWRENNDGE